MPLVIESKPSASASRACSRSSRKRADMSSPSGNCARSIRPNCIASSSKGASTAPSEPPPGLRGQSPRSNRAYSTASLADSLGFPAPGMRTPFRLEDAAALHGEHGHHGLVDLHRVPQRVVDHPAPVADLQHRDVGLAPYREAAEAIGFADRARGI